MTARARWGGTALRTATVASLLCAGVSAGLAACAGVTTDPKTVESIALDTVAAPFIVAGDTLRDSLGVVRPLHATAYNPQGSALAGVPIRFRSADAHVTVDSVTGIVTADSARPTPIRLMAQAGGLQTIPDSIYVVLAPDSVAVVNSSDSVRYSLRDTTANVSSPLSLRLFHRNAPSAATAVPGYLVGYGLANPRDTAFAQLVDNLGHRARADTTRTDGVAGRRLRISAARLPAGSDTVVVLATVRLRGALVSGAPFRFTVIVKPQS